MKKVLIFINMAIIGFAIAFVVVQLFFTPSSELYEEFAPPEGANLER